MKIPFEVSEAAGANSSKFRAALISRVKGDYLDVIAQCDQLISDNPYHAHALFLKGDAMFSLGRYEEFVSCIDSAIRLHPDYGYRGYRRGEYFESQVEKVNRFVSLFDNAIRDKPNDMKPWYCRGIAKCFVGETKEALRCFERVIEISPDHFEAWCHKGGILGISQWHKKPKRIALQVPQQLKNAIAAYDRALEIRPDQSALVNRGLVLIKAGRRNAALYSFDEAIKMGSQYGDAWLQKGVLLVKMRKRKEADKCFEKALQLDPEYIQEYRLDIDEWRPGPLDWD